MYTFFIKEHSPNIPLVVTRSLMVLSALGCLLYQTDTSHFINGIAAVILLGTAVFIVRLALRFKPFTLLVFAALILLLATHSINFAVILVLIGWLVQKLYKQPIVIVNADGVILKRMLDSPLHPWADFNNIILKDNLLTLDFKKNQLLQLNIEDSVMAAEESSFNSFCSQQISS